MKFNVDQSKAPSLSAMLGILPDRQEIILDYIATVLYDIHSNEMVIKKLSVYYKDVAEFCNTVEEYAFAMHNLIFNLAAAGAPMDAAKNKN